MRKLGSVITGELKEKQERTGRPLGTTGSGTSSIASLAEGVPTERRGGVPSTKRRLPPFVEQFLTAEVPDSHALTQRLPATIDARQSELLKGWVAEREQVLSVFRKGKHQVMLTKLFLAFPQQDRGDVFRKHVIPMYVKHVAKYPDIVLEEACNELVRTEDWLPQIAKLCRQCDAALHSRRERIRRLRMILAVGRHPRPPDGDTEDWRLRIILDR